jgi:hypothetical protein
LRGGGRGPQGGGRAQGHDNEPDQPVELADQGGGGAVGIEQLGEVVEGEREVDALHAHDDRSVPRPARAQEHAARRQAERGVVQRHVRSHAARELGGPLQAEQPQLEPELRPRGPPASVQVASWPALDHAKQPRSTAWKARLPMMTVALGAAGGGRGGGEGLGRARPLPARPLLISSPRAL